MRRISKSESRLSRFLIEGGYPLEGVIEVAANKNAILPMMAATLLTEQDCVIRNVPKIADVYVMSELLQSVGARVDWTDDRTLVINTADVRDTNPDPTLVAKMRASVLVAGPLLARFGHWAMDHPGGDSIGTRSIRAHLEGFQLMGSSVDIGHGRYEVKNSKPHPASILLEEASVTATENLMLLASRIPGTTTILNAACEPHIENLAVMLQSMGVGIDGAGTNRLRITGILEPAGTTAEVWPDHTEAGTFAALAAACRGSVTIRNVRQEHLENVLHLMRRMNIELVIDGNELTIYPSELTSVRQIVTGPWPGFPTDLASVFIVLATQAQGMTLVHDWMYESRMFFIDRLKEMGAQIVLADPHRSVVSGPSELRGQEFVSPDIRAGIALVMASLIARGHSEIDRIELIDRGYEQIDGRLRALGAHITRED
jgi:UDP-N-acetylglucosamine 1-carboxyvinyltransferase